MSKEKGARWERHYRRALNASGHEDVDYVKRVGTSLEWVDRFYCVRMPSSGSGTGDELPDLHIWLATYDGSEVYQYAAEVKAGDGRVSFDAAKVAGLRSYADKTGALPIAMVHLDYEGDFVFRIDDLHKTPDGNYTVTETRDAPGADTFDDFVQAPYST